LHTFILALAALDYDGRMGDFIIKAASSHVNDISAHYAFILLLPFTY